MRKELKKFELLNFYNNDIHSTFGKVKMMKTQKYSGENDIFQQLHVLFVQRLNFQLKKHFGWRLTMTFAK